MKRYRKRRQKRIAYEVSVSKLELAGEEEEEA